MEFVESVRLVYNLASGLEVVVDHDLPDALLRQAETDSEALDLICEWLAAQRCG